KALLTESRFFQLIRSKNDVPGVPVQFAQFWENYLSSELGVSKAQLANLGRIIRAKASISIDSWINISLGKLAWSEGSFKASGNDSKWFGSSLADLPTERQSGELLLKLLGSVCGDASGAKASVSELLQSSALGLEPKVAPANLPTDHLPQGITPADQDLAATRRPHGGDYDPGNSSSRPRGRCWSRSGRRVSFDDHRRPQRSSWNATGPALGRRTHFVPSSQRHYGHGLRRRHNNSAFSSRENRRLTFDFLVGRDLLDMPRPPQKTQMEAMRPTSLNTTADSSDNAALEGSTVQENLAPTGNVTSFGCVTSEPGHTDTNERPVEMDDMPQRDSSGSLRMDAVMDTHMDTDHNGRT
ncbi:unnamed protein product, partial [Oikopleura dioica]